MTTPHEKNATLDDLDAEVVEDLTVDDSAADVEGGRHPTVTTTTITVTTTQL